jgi:hypothetical protein
MAIRNLLYDMYSRLLITLRLLNLIWQVLDLHWWCWRWGWRWWCRTITIRLRLVVLVAFLRPVLELAVGADAAPLILKGDALQEGAAVGVEPTFTLDFQLSVVRHINRICNLQHCSLLTRPRVVISVALMYDGRWVLSW